MEKKTFEGGYQNNRKHIPEAEACEILRTNIITIMSLYHMPTVEALARMVGVDEDSVKDVLEPDNNRLPGIYPVISALSDFSGYTVDELLYSRVSPVRDVYSMNRWAKTKERIAGLYQIYYFDTSRFAGRDTEADSSAVCYGLLLLYDQGDSGGMKAAALMDLSREEMTEYFRKTREHSMADSEFHAEKAYEYIRENYSEESMFHGIVKIMSTVFAVHLAYRERECASMLFRRPDNPNERFIGSLGESLSVSGGRDLIPCAQVVGLSRYELTVSTEELARHLRIRQPDPVLDRAVLQDFVQFLRSKTSVHGKPEGQAVALTQDEEMLILEGMIRKIVMDTVYRSLFRTMKVTGADDDEFCRFIGDNRKQ